MLVSLKITTRGVKGESRRIKGSQLELRGVKRSQQVSRGVKRIQEPSSQKESRGKGVQRKLRDGWNLVVFC